MNKYRKHCYILTEEEKSQFLAWEEKNPDKLKQLTDEYIKQYVEDGDELENVSGFWADLLSEEIARYQIDWFFNN